jgi:hypothetical protein
MRAVKSKPRFEFAEATRPITAGDFLPGCFFGFRTAYPPLQSMLERRFKSTLIAD